MKLHSIAASCLLAIHGACPADWFVSQGDQSLDSYRATWQSKEFATGRITRAVEIRAGDRFMIESMMLIRIEDDDHPTLFHSIYSFDGKDTWSWDGTNNSGRRVPGRSIPNEGDLDSFTRAFVREPMLNKPYAVWREGAAKQEIEVGGGGSVYQAVSAEYPNIAIRFCESTTERPASTDVFHRGIEAPPFVTYQYGKGMTRTVPALPVQTLVKADLGSYGVHEVRLFILELDTEYDANEAEFDLWAMMPDGAIVLDEVEGKTLIKNGTKHRAFASDEVTSMLDHYSSFGLERTRTDLTDEIMRELGLTVPPPKMEPIPG